MNSLALTYPEISTHHIRKFFLTIPLLILSLAATHQAHSASDYCNNVFSNGVQTLNADNSYINFGYNARLTNASSNSLDTSSIGSNPWSTTKSCGSDHCSNMHTQQEIFMDDSFRFTSTEYTVLLAKNTEETLGENPRGNYSISSVALMEGAIANFSPDQRFYEIGELYLGYKSQLRLPSGEYWVRDLFMEAESRIEVAGEGTVTFHTFNAPNMAFKAMINDNTKDPSRFVLINHTGALQLDVSSKVYGFIYGSKDKVVVGHSAKVIGGIASTAIDLQSESEVIYDPVAAQVIAVNGLCQSATPGHQPVIRPPQFHTEYSGADENNLLDVVVFGEAVPQNGLAIKKVILRTYQGDIAPYSVENNQFRFKLTVVPGRNRFLVIVSDYRDREYTTEHETLHQLPPEFINVSPASGTIVRSPDINIAGRVRSLWPNASLRINFEGAYHSLQRIYYGVHWFSINKKLSPGLNHLLLQLHSPSEQVIEREIIIDYQPDSL